MSKDVAVSVKTAVPAVLAHWDDLAEDQIAKLAEDVWYNDPMDQGQADLVLSLSICKRIKHGQTTEELLALWELIEDARFKERNKGYGGLIFAEGKKNYRTARQFIEERFVPELLHALETKFDALTIEASRKTASSARVDAFEDADSKIRNVVYAFDFLPTWQKKLDKLYERLSNLINQLMDAEEQIGTPWKDNA